MTAKELVSWAIDDSGAPLDMQTRSKMEHCFSTGLQDIRLHCSEASRVANDALGSVAFTIDHHICLRPGFDRSKGRDYTRVLAHEIAHAVQKRRSGQRMRESAAPGWLLEWEADRAAGQVLRGQPVSQLTTDAWAGPRCWDIEGHYYTILWISLAAGLPLAEAKRNAFYAQLPDQVIELDAVPSGFSWFEEFAWASYSKLNAGGLEALQYDPQMGPAMRTYLKACPWVLEYWKQQSDPSIDKMVADWKIQAGMHALTGRVAEEETETRLKRLHDLKAGSFEFALALHPFGDSYAHRIASPTSRMMYPPPLGHGCKGHGADMLKTRSELYVVYGLTLFELLVDKWETQKTPHWDKKKVAENLEAVSSLSRDRQVPMLLIDAASALVRSTGQKLEDCSEVLNSVYKPEKDSVPWHEFYANYHTPNLGDDIPLTEDMLRQATDCAEKWAIGAETFGIPPLMELFDRVGLLSTKIDEIRGVSEF